MTVAKINVDSLSFGVEIECTMPYDSVMRGGRHNGIQVPALPEGWTAEQDGSIHPSAENHMGVEIVSPVLRGSEGMRQLVAVCNWLRSQGAKVNDSCGFHCHVGVQGQVFRKVGRVVAAVAQFEKALYAVTGTKSRERGLYCQPIKNDPAYVARYKEKADSGRSLDRYRSLNLLNLGRGRRATMEFRVFAGTVNVVKAVGYVRLVLGIVQKAASLTRDPSWDAKPWAAGKAYYANKGEGQYMVSRLFYWLGWKKGSEQTEFGVATCTDCPEQNVVMSELMRLAAKYDAAV